MSETKQLRILYSCVPYDHGRSGISVYMREQVAALRAAGHHVTVIAEPDAAAAFAGCPAIVFPAYAARYAVLSMLYHLLVLPFRIRRRDFDVCILAAANRRALAFCRVPCFAVVHDLSQYHIPAKYDRFRMFYIKHVLPFFVRRAQRVIAISHSTAEDLRRFWRVDDKIINVVPNGAEVHAGASFSAGDLEALRRKMGIVRPYLLYVSRLEHPGKNHLRLMAAFEKLPAALTQQYDLVMAGAPWPGAEAITGYAAQSSLREHFVFTGFVESKQCAMLFAGASGYVFPSLFEGFGLSLIEAMRCGLPCACSRNSSLGEIGAGCALLFDPEDVTAVSNAMRQLLTDPVGNAERVAAGKKRAMRYTWSNNAAQLTWKITDYLARRPEIFGVPVDNVTMAQALARIETAVMQSRRCGICANMQFVNAHCLNLACGDSNYRMILNCADAVWPDGSGVKLAGKILGFPIPENVNGTDMFPLLADGRFSLFLLGGSHGVAEKAAERTCAAYPSARIVGTASGFFADEAAEERVIAAINAARPDLLLVGMGVPRQEKWIAANRARLHCGVAIGVGGLLDFYSGRIPRAPLWMRRFGMEWLYRLWQEPRRLFKRYVVGNPLFLWRVAVSFLSRGVRL